ncbi:hypothetical protein BURPS406E_R0247 [Burkholderia pseudomallei 406e]|nr:hypothetical protein BURPS406E_R0247 [Burkholderia pseudomallei 406e]EDO94042.1 hypothetical protein BURPSPAST_A1048 [Burkholderia pseudomallei Pasteur 52237]EDS84476.1 hypothetical protein BURPSS13_H0043 [Burkholderia pseudomallei S13]
MWPLRRSRASHRPYSSARVDRGGEFGASNAGWFRPASERGRASGACRVPPMPGVVRTDRAKGARRQTNARKERAA